MKAEGVKLPFKETASYIAGAYKDLSAEEKKKYEGIANGLKERYLIEMAEVILTYVPIICYRWNIILLYSHVVQEI